MYYLWVMPPAVRLPQAAPARLADVEPPLEHLVERQAVRDLERDLLRLGRCLEVLQLRAREDPSARTYVEWGCRGNPSPNTLSGSAHSGGHPGGVKTCLLAFGIS